MIDIANIEIELYGILKKRAKEMLLLESFAPKEEQDATVYRACLILMLYAHFEGFFKQALDDFYVSIINDENIPISKANHSIQACSLLTMFKDLQGSTNKSGIFKGKLPDDSQLHLFHRRKEFVESVEKIFAPNVYAKIPVANQSRRDDKSVKGLVDTESNLSQTIISKILFQLGLPHDKFKEFDADIGKLRHLRNEIGHGTFTLARIVSKDDYKRLRRVTVKICIGIAKLVIDSLKNEEYLKPEYRPAAHSF